MNRMQFRLDTMNLLLYISAGLVMAIPGLLVTPGRSSWMAPLLAGLVLLTVAVLRTGPSEAGTALALLIALNSSYWLSYLLWSVRPTLIKRSPPYGEDPFAGAVALWALVFLAVFFYQLIVFVYGALQGGKARTISVIGFLGLIFQSTVTFRDIWIGIEGA